MDKELLAEVAQVTAESTPGRPCSVCQALGEMEPETAATFRHLMGLSVSDAGHFAIGKAFRKRGYQLGDSRIANCRRKHGPWTTT